MLASKNACEILRKLGKVTEKDHFGGDAFSVKRMFATVWHDAKKVNLRFTPEQQKHFLEADSEAFNEIDNGWGRMGWTSVNLKYIDAKTFKEAVEAAYQNASASSKAKPKAKKKSKKSNAS